MKPRVAIFFTGGTICMSLDPLADGAVPALSGEQILGYVRGLDQVAEVAVVNFGRLPGPHVSPARMLELARALRERFTADSDLAGAVVTHGTDTLEETAYLLDLVLDEERPIVVVGAMRNSSELSWDGPANLMSAVRVACDPVVRGLGVVVAMADQILAARDATKTHTESVDTFQSRDLGPLGLIDKDRIVVVNRPIRRERLAVERLEERVEIVQLAAGSSGRLVDLAVADGVRGLVVEGTGRGNIPLSAWPAVRNALDAGVVVVLTTRCHRGRVLDTYAYEGAGRQATRRGAILAGLLPSHKARLKLMALLGAGLDRDAIRASFET